MRVCNSWPLTSSIQMVCFTLWSHSLFRQWRRCCCSLFWPYSVWVPQRKEPVCWPPSLCWTAMPWRAVTSPYSTTSTTLAPGEDLGLIFEMSFFFCVCVLETNEEANLKKLTPKYCFNMMYVGLLFFKNYKKNIINNQRFFCLSVLPSRWSFPMIPFPLKTSELFQECWTWNGTGLPRILNLKWLSCCPITSSRSDFWCY